MVWVLDLDGCGGELLLSYILAAWSGLLTWLSLENLTLSWFEDGICVLASLKKDERSSTRGVERPRVLANGSEQLTFGVLPDRPHSTWVTVSRLPVEFIPDGRAPGYVEWRSIGG